MSRITRTRWRDACDDHDERRAEAKAESEMYSECGNFTLVRNARLHEV
jgi:hypothetical protein